MELVRSDTRTRLRVCWLSLVRSSEITTRLPFSSRLFLMTSSRFWRRLNITIIGPLPVPAWCSKAVTGFNIICCQGNTKLLGTHVYNEFCGVFVLYCLYAVHSDRCTTTVLFIVVAGDASHFFII